MQSPKQSLNMMTTPFLQGTMVLLPKLALNQENSLTFDPSLPWVKGLLEELNSGLDEESKNEMNGEGHLLIDLTLQKKWDGASKNENLMIHGSVEASYFTHCVRCLDPMAVSLQLDLGACFLPQTLMNEPEYQDQITVYMYEEELDLYFYPKKEVDLVPFLREQIYLNLDSIPLHSEDCKGLCQTCGINLNKEQCSHHP